MELAGGGFKTKAFVIGRAILEQMNLWHEPIKLRSCSYVCAHQINY